ncbi:hypothetical protein CM318V1_230006 [Carnobacterium maltaromaticum]|nr:hypothetical protein CM318V1_230006 [Carnobacterium maltaromaticum]
MTVPPNSKILVIFIKSVKIKGFKQDVLRISNFNYGLKIFTNKSAYNI